MFGSIRFLNRLVKIPCTCSDSQDRLFAGLFLWFYASNKDKNTTVRISVKSCIYGWKIEFKIDFFSSDSWLLKALKIILSCFLNSFFRGKFSFQLNLGLSQWTFYCALSLVYAPNKNKSTIVRFSVRIVLIV